MNLKRILAGAAEMSPARAYQFLRAPWKMAIALAGPGPQSDDEALRALFPGLGQGSLQMLRREWNSNHDFFLEINRKMVEVRQRRARFDLWKEFLYLVVRMARPGLVVETGVFDGESSAVILQALADGGRGNLISIDLPAVEAISGSTHCMRETSLPAGLPPGWVIPDSLRGRHVLELGDSRQILPRVFEHHPTVDIFFHDSLHTFEHQTFEYSTAWEHLPAGGLLLSDDVLWTPAFHRFSRRMRRPYVRVGGGVFGAMRK